ncbi:hypothetical protein QFC21_004866 [Naganishia friedmannii]|uniref:Uncharacterized protein n=1 Tax=Naganishia friedmannii TaxID=89922 RepID=A0ACC2VE31_9TREE|nr:hypothetical protein QFC21_004866 [Naganishia friedmannii]
MTHQMEDPPQSDAEGSESDPSSGQEFSPDYSDTDSSSGEATITAGPSGKGNLIGRALLAAGKMGHNPTRSNGGIDRRISESESGGTEWQHSQGGGANVEPTTGYPASSGFMPLERTLSNPAGWANEVSRHLLKSSMVSSEAGPMHQSNGLPGSPHTHNVNSGQPIPNAPKAQFYSVPTMATVPSMSYPSPSIPMSGPTKQRRFPETTASAFKPIQASHSVDRSGNLVREGASGFSRSQNSSATTLTLGSRPTTTGRRSPSGEPTVVRTASLPRMPRLQGFSPLVQTSSLSFQEARQVSSPIGNGNEGNVVDDGDPDQEGIYMDLSESRRKRSLRRRRKAASDGSRTPVSPALTISSPLVSPALSSLPSSIDSSPIQQILGYASARSKARPRDADQDYSARSELRKRRGSQHNPTQPLHYVLDPSYPFHIPPPRLAHQPRSDFSAASTSGDSAGVSSGYTASADSGDTRSDASRSSSSVLGLSLDDDVLGLDGRSRRNHGSAQYSRHLMSDAGTWDGNYTDTLHSPSPIFSAYETDVPAMSLPPSASGFTQSSRFPLVIFSLRLLAVVPASLGALSLMWNAIFPPLTTLGHVGHSAGDNLMSLPWAALTGMFCFELTTGLTHRWLLYYSLAPTLLRLVSLQSICWPSTFITLKYLGSIDILFAWIVVATTTACSRSVQIWVTSNVPEISTRTLKPTLPAPIKADATDPAGRGYKDVTNQRAREASDKSKRNHPQTVHGRVRERFWDWNEIVGAVWVRVGILYIVTTGYLLCHRHL